MGFGLDPVDLAAAWANLQQEKQMCINNLPKSREELEADKKEAIINEISLGVFQNSSPEKTDSP